MALVEKQLEAKICTALTALALDDTQVIGAWKSTATEEATDTSTFVTVKVSPRSYSRAQIPTADVAVSIEIAVRPDLDADGSVIADAADKVMGKLQAWQDDLNTAVTALACDTFDVEGFRFDGGSVPALEIESGRNALTLGFTITGVVVA